MLRLNVFGVKLQPDTDDTTTFTPPAHSPPPGRHHTVGPPLKDLLKRRSCSWGAVRAAPAAAAGPSATACTVVAKHGGHRPRGQVTLDRTRVLDDGFADGGRDGARESTRTSARAMYGAKRAPGPGA